MPNKYFLSGIAIACCISAFAQNTITVNVDYDGTPSADNIELCVEKADSILVFEYIDKIPYTFQVEQEGEYTVTLSCTGYESWQQTLSLTNGSVIDAGLTKNPLILDELTVESDNRPKTTATGEIYRLSTTAKKCGDPFRALSEIPVLDVDIINQSITMRGGETPLIMIDGKLFNSGIAPIDPKFIESVEIKEVMNARYLHMGISKILNIRLKRDVPLYLFTDVRTRHDIPICEGFLGANFETGTKKIAISGGVFGDYIHKNAVDMTVNEEFQGIHKNRNGRSLKNNLGWDGRLLLKWVPDKHNYLAALIMGENSNTKTKRNEHGLYGSDSDSESEFKSDLKNRLISEGMLASVFHEYSFDNSARFTSYIKYNKSSVLYDDESIEYIGIQQNQYRECEKSYRNQYTVSIDFDSGDRPYGNINAGNEFEYTYDKKQNRITTPIEVADIRLASNYTYLTYSNSAGSIYYMASAGLQYMHVATPADKNFWWRPKAAASLTYMLKNRQTVRLYYYLTNVMPLSNQLFRFNHSTNPWLRFEGNPNLVPLLMNRITLSYDRMIGEVRSRFSALYVHNNDMIQSYIHSDNDVMIQTFRNYGKYNGINISTDFGWWAKNWNIGFNASFISDCYSGFSAKRGVILSASIRHDFGKFFVYSKIAWQSRAYNPATTTEYLNPTESHIQIAWQPTRQLYLSLGLPYFAGIRKDRTLTKQENYNSVITRSYKSSSLRPWLLISWTIRRNREQAIDNKMPNY
ncbi:MAG: outer membrane beta-barrel protein [Muribaculaceae bacterium]|nr:outer membrane beta-barrel protein [Muribaculaceae bacterium]